MVALAAISFGSVYADTNISVKTKTTVSDITLQKKKHVMKKKGKKMKMKKGMGKMKM
jgi:hypothetical protein